MPGSQSDADELAGVTVVDKKKLAAVSRNNAAMASLTLAFTTDELISIIMNAQSSEWPDGLACEVVKELLEKYKPEGIMSLVDEKIALHKIRMGQNKDPAKLFNRIVAVETRFNTKTKKIKEEELIAVVLSQAPKTYQAVLTAEQRMRKQLGVTVTVNDLKEVMKEHFKLLNCEENDKEVTLHVNDSEKKKSNNRNNRHR